MNKAFFILIVSSMSSNQKAFQCSSYLVLETLNEEMNSWKIQFIINTIIFSWKVHRLSISKNFNFISYWFYVASWQIRLNEEGKLEAMRIRLTRPETCSANIQWLLTTQRWSESMAYCASVSNLHGLQEYLVIRANYVPVNPFYICQSGFREKADSVVQTVMAYTFI